MSLHERNFVLKQEVVNLWESGYFFDFRNYLTLIATMCLSAFPMCAFVLEWLAGKGLPRFIVSIHCLSLISTLFSSCTHVLLHT